jgi:hypothetical protein
MKEDQSRDGIEAKRDGEGDVKEKVMMRTKMWVKCKSNKNGREILRREFESREERG